jgi:hypothetical protein
MVYPIIIGILSRTEKGFRILEVFTGCAILLLRVKSYQSFQSVLRSTVVKIWELR